MDQVAGSSRAARLLAVLAVLLGLLAMHGVASAHHAGAATPVADHAAAPVTQGHAGQVAHQHPDAQDASAAAGSAALSGALAAPVGPSCDADCSSIAALCVAVLAGAALALILTRRRTVPLLLAPDHRQARTPAPAVRYARGPDPVRELCVSRT